MAVVFLLRGGGLLGPLVDRIWLLTAEAEAKALTTRAMAEHLDLSPVEEARVRRDSTAFTRISRRRRSIAVTSYLAWGVEPVRLYGR